MFCSETLAVSSGPNVGLWSLENGSKVIEVKCSNTIPLTLSNEGAIKKSLSIDSNITDMAWINESSDSLLAVGSDDGSLRIWRDLGEEW
jgi:WD40 repeat protein